MLYGTLAERIESAIDDPRALVALSAEIASANVTDAEREMLFGLIDRYETDARLEAEAAETEAVLAQEGLDDAVS